MVVSCYVKPRPMVLKCGVIIIIFLKIGHSHKLLMVTLQEKGDTCTVHILLSIGTSGCSRCKTSCKINLTCAHDTLPGLINSTSLTHHVVIRNTTLLNLFKFSEQYFCFFGRYCQIHERAIRS